METIVVELVDPPKGKGRPRATRAGHVYTPLHTRKHEAALRFAAGEAMNGAPPLQGPISLTIIATFPIPTSWSKKKQRAALAGLVPHLSAPDADNIYKMTDAFNEVVWRDDRQVVEAVIKKAYGARPCTRFEVRVPIHVVFLSTSFFSPR